MTVVLRNAGLMESSQEMGGEETFLSEFAVSRQIYRVTHPQPPVDTKTKVAFQYKGLILKRNFCFDVNRRLGTN